MAEVKSFSQGENWAAEHEIETDVHFERIRKDLLNAYDNLSTDARIESNNVAEAIRNIKLDSSGLDYVKAEPKDLGTACVEQFETALNSIEFKNEIVKKAIFSMLDIWRNPAKGSKQEWGNERF